MWENISTPSHGILTLRRIFSYALAALVAAFLWILVITPFAHATDAGWSGDAIQYNSRTYRSQTADGTNPPGLANGQTYYFSADANTDYVIYFDQGTDPKTATSAQYATYHIDGDNMVKDTGPTKISLTPQNLSASSTRAVWNGTDLNFDSRTFSANNGGPFIVDSSGPKGLASGTQYYLNRGRDSGNGTSTAAIIYFPAGSDIKTANKATYQEYDLTTDGFGDAKGSSKSIDVTPQADSPSTGTTKNPADSDGSHCAIDGIGWIVCPVSNFLAKGMDNIYDLLKNYLTVSTITNDTQGGLYRSWSLVRNIANVAFVIVFVIIIYSQLTGMGISNYGIKKLLPRLIIGAILVNVSYWICAVAVDLSNIAGSSFQDFLVAIRESLRTANHHPVYSWQSVSSFILAGGTAAAAAALGLGIFIHSVGASAGAAVILLLPMLVGLLLAVLVALLVLAARQALIILFVIVSPLAFVAYLLPNTEKWFDKWRDAFGTLLVLFPIFALIFGGSQLAGFLIIDNADQINMVLLGMFVQVAPLVITPMLVKLSGGIIGRLTNMVNNPNKGFIDRTRKWSQEQSGIWAAKNMARTDPVRRRQVFRRFALARDEQMRTRDARKKLYDLQNDARWANSTAFGDVDQLTRAAQESKSLGETNSEIRYNASKVTSAELRDLDIKLRDAKLKLENAKVDADIQWEHTELPAIAEQKLRARVSADTVAALKAEHDAAYEEFKAGEAGAYPASQMVSALAAQSRHDTREVALQGMRAASAKRARMVEFNEMLAKANDPGSPDKAYADTLLAVAGGIEGSEGAQRALAQALSEQHKARAETISNANAILEHSNLSAEETLRIAQNISIKGITVTDDIKEAAAKRVAGGGVVPHILELLKSVNMTATGDEHLRNTIVEALKGNSVRPKFIGYGLMDQMTQGLAGPVNDTMIDGWVQKTLIEGKFSANELVSQDKDTLVRVNEALDRLPRTPDVVRALTNLKLQITNAQTNAQMRDRAGERMSVLDEMKKKL